jgi:tetratricopeptide (TPR) repeat protein
MIHRMKKVLVPSALAALVLLPGMPGDVEAQSSRFRVMVPNMAPAEGVAARFGERVANNIRNGIDFDRHVGVSERDMDRAAREYSMRARDLSCLDARQLANLTDVQVVMCGSYSAVDRDQVEVQATFFTVPGGEEYRVDSFVIATRDEQGAARIIMERFVEMTRQVEFVSYCQQEYASSNWQGALNYCTQAVELAPNSKSARFALARTYLELEDFEKSLAGFEVILAEDPYDGDALQNAGYAATQVGESAKARTFYTRYLEINPGNVPVRLRVARELALAGDFQNAMDFVQQGLRENPDDPGLLENYGVYAFQVAAARENALPQQEGETVLPPEVASLYRDASRTLLRVLELEKEESQPIYAINAARAHLKLEEPQEALRIVDLGLGIFPQDANLWAEKATVQNRLGNVDGAVASLQRAVEINPQFPSARARMGSLLVDAGRADDGIRFLREAAQAGEAPADQLASIIFREAFNNGIQGDRDLDRGIRLIVLIKDEMPISDEFRQQMDFWHGQGIFRRAMAAQQPSTPASARATLPQFQEARRLFVAGQAYVQRSGVVNLQQHLEAVDTYIDIQQAIIRRGGGE